MEEQIISSRQPQKNHFTQDVKVTNSPSVSVNPASGVGSGQKTVATAGTAVSLSSTTAVTGVSVKALRGNTGNIYIGDSSVDSTNGLVLERGASVDISIDDIADVYIDSDNNGEGVSFIFTIA